MYKILIVNLLLHNMVLDGQIMKKCSLVNYKILNGLLENMEVNTKRTDKKLELENRRYD